MGAHFDELSGISSVADYTLMVYSFPGDILITASAPERVVQQERKAELFLNQFFEQQVRAECKKLHGKNDDATMRKFHLMDSSNRVIHSVIVATDQRAAINFQRKMAPQRRKIDELGWRIKELAADKAIAHREGDTTNERYVAKQILRAKKKKQ